MQLKLFVSTRFHDDVEAEESLQRLTEELFLAGHDPDIEIIDITSAPDAADEWKIIATPSLVRTDCTPEIRVIGDLRDVPELIEVLTKDDASSS